MDINPHSESNSNTKSSPSPATSSTTQLQREQQRSPIPSTRGPKRKRQSLVYDLSISSKKDGSYIQLPLLEIENGRVVTLCQQTQTFSIPKTRTTSASNSNSNQTKNAPLHTEAELLLDKIVTPILRNSGWKINSNLTSFRFKTMKDSNQYANLTARRKQMIACIARVQPQLERYGNDIIMDKNKLEPILENMIVEDLLLTRLSRSIEFQNVVQSSLIDFSDETQIGNVKRMAKDNGTKKNDIVKPRNDTKIGVKDNGTKTKDTVEALNDTKIRTKANGSNTRSGKTIKFIKIEQLLPKFYAFNVDKQLVNNKFINEVRSTVLNIPENDGANDNHDNKHLLKIKVVDVKEDPYSVALVITGSEEVAKNARMIAMKKVHRLLATFNVKRIINDGKSYEIDVPFDSSTNLGISCFPQAKKEIAGLWIQTKSGEHISQVLGEGTMKGAILEKMKSKKGNWIDIRTIRDKNKILKSARNADEKGMLAKLYLSKDISIDTVDRLLSKGLNIRRRDGSTCGTVKRNNIAKKRKKDDVEKQENSSNSKSSPKNSSNLQSSSDGTPMPPQKKQKKGGTHRQHFVEKMKGVVEIEYRNYKIPHRIINHAMWNAHLKYVGDVCQESCECIGKVGALTKDVLREHIADAEQSDKNWTNPFGLQPVDSMIGFSNNFCTKFYEKVKANFSTDTPYQTLQRLLSMWKKHIKQRRFGITCENDCSCGDSWEALFLPACEDCFKEKENPKHNGDTRSSNSLLQQNGQSKEKAPEYGSTLRPVSIRPSKTSFGLYFVEKDGFVVVSSVDPNGFIKRKLNNINIGSKVAGISEDGDEMNPVCSVKELENTYNVSKLVNRKLKLWFSIGDEEVDASHENGHQWTTGGAWLGNSSEVGWAGGSSVVKSHTESSVPNDLKKLGKNNQTENIDNESIEMETYHALPESVDESTHLDSCEKRDILELLSDPNIVGIQPVGIQPVGIQSILRNVKEKRPQKEREVSINEKRNQVFIITYNVSPVLQTKMTLSHERTSEASISSKQPIEVFLQFLQQKCTKQELISLSDAIQKQINILQDCAMETENQIEYDTIEHDLQVLKHKKSALLIFMTAREAIAMSNFVNQAVAITFSLSRTQIDHIMEEEKKLENSLYCSLYVNERYIESTSKVPYQEEVSWPSSTVLSTLYSKSVLSTYNEDDAAIIELRKGSPTGENALLSKASIPLAELISNLNTNNSERVFKYQLSTPDKKNGGTMSLKYGIVNALNEMLVKERTEIAEKLRTLIFSIKNIRLQYPDNPHLMNADMSFDNMSLLHVAITCCESSMLHELIKLGAQSQCSALDYARNLVKKRDLCKDKYHEMIQILSSYCENVL